MLGTFIYQFFVFSLTFQIDIPIILNQANLAQHSFMVAAFIYCGFFQYQSHHKAAI